MRAFLRPLDYDSPQSQQGDVEKEHFGDCLCCKGGKDSVGMAGQLDILEVKQSQTQVEGR